MLVTTNAWMTDEEKATGTHWAVRSGGLSANGGGLASAVLQNLQHGGLCVSPKGEGKNFTRASALGLPYADDRCPTHLVLVGLTGHSGPLQQRLTDGLTL